MIDDDMQTYNNCDDASQTESELDDDDAERVNLLKKVPLQMSTFREYLIWQTKHKVKDEKVKTGFVDQLQESAEVK